MMQGRFLHEDDITIKRHAVIGRLVAQDLFKNEILLAIY